MKEKYNFDEPVVRRGSHCVKWDEAGDPDVIPMWVADMDFAAAPAIRQAVEERARHGVFGYELVPEAYYESVISWFQRRHQWTIDRSWLLYTTGVVPAISAIIRSFCGPLPRLDEADQPAAPAEPLGVIIQTPVYNCFFSSILNNGCRVVENPLHYEDGRYTIDFDDLEAKAALPYARLLLLCNPHNPAGRRWTREELERLNDICLRHDVVVISDEIHSELTDGERYEPYAAVSEQCRDNCIVCSSPSKSFNIAGLQMAHIVCSNPLWRRRIDRAINISEICDVNPFAPLACMAAYNESEEWLDELCAYIHANYETLLLFCREHLPQLTVVPLEATYLAWIDISRLGMASDRLTVRLLNDGHVQVSSGTIYGDSAGKNFIRLNLACPRSQLMEALQRIERVIQSL